MPMPPAPSAALLRASRASSLLLGSSLAVGTLTAQSLRKEKLHAEESAATASAKLPIYSTPSPGVTLVETHTSLERHVGDVRSALQHATKDARHWLQSTIDRWIGVERRIEARVSQLIPDDEPLTPGLLYVGVATLAGSIFTRYRALPIRLLTPPTLLLVSLHHLQPKLAHNLGEYYTSIESAHLPSLTEQRRALSQRLRASVDEVGEGAQRLGERGRRSLDRVGEVVQDTTGLRLSGATGAGGDASSAQQREPARKLV